MFYVTGNPEKFNSAKKYFDRVQSPLKQIELDIPEYQSDSIEEIAVGKALHAFDLVQEPLFVNDSGWMFPALNGFPGAYMKFMNKWFKPEDFISLLKRHDDKTVILRQSLVYKDAERLKVFNFDIKGKLIDIPRGNRGVPSDKVITLTSDGKTIAEHNDEGYKNDESEEKMWGEFIGWLKDKAK